MEKRGSVSLSFCEKCGSKVSSRDELCSNCGVLPYQDDRSFFIEYNVPNGLHYDNWSEELHEKFEDWCDNETNPRFCKDCGMDLNEVKKYDDDGYLDEETGEVIITNNHPCNFDSPIFE